MNPSEEVIEELEAAAEHLFYQRLDVASLDSINDFIDELASAQGYADILVNNAGITAHEFVSNTTKNPGSTLSTSTCPARFA